MAGDIKGRLGEPRIGDDRIGSLRQRVEEALRAPLDVERVCPPEGCGDPICCTTLTRNHMALWKRLANELPATSRVLFAPLSAFSPDRPWLRLAVASEVAELAARVGRQRFCDLSTRPTIAVPAVLLTTAPRSVIEAAAEADLLPDVEQECR